MEELNSFVHSIAAFFGGCFGRSSKRGPRHGLPRAGPRYVSVGSRYSQDTSSGGYKVHIPPVSASPGVRGFIPREEPIPPFRDHLRGLRPQPKPEQRITVGIPLHQNTHSSKPDPWYSVLTEEEKTKYKYNDPMTNFHRWRSITDRDAWGRGQDRRKMSNRIARQKQNSWRPMMVTAKRNDMGISPGPQAFRHIGIN
jgi:hypothetical protein